MGLVFFSVCLAFGPGVLVFFMALGLLGTHMILFGSIRLDAF